MSKFSDVLSKLMKQYDIGDSELAERVDVNRTTVNRWKTGERSPKIEKLPEIAKVFHTTPSAFVSPDILSNDEKNILPIYNQLKNENKVIIYDEAKRLLNKQNGIVSINDAKHNYSGSNHELEILGSVSAGTGEYLDDNAQRETIQYFGNVPVHDYAVRVNGDSMTPLFEDGQIIFVKTDNSDFINGQIVIANVAGEAFVKKIELTENGAFLISLNSKYEPIEITDNSELKIEGTVIL